MAELNEKFNDEDVNVETCHGGSKGRKLYLGITKLKTGSWQARVRHPKRKVDVYLGIYKTAEEAALVVKKKKAEFEQLFKSETCVNVETRTEHSNAKQKKDEKLETCRGGSEVLKHFPGVSKSGSKWLARVRHPMMRIDVSCGRYESPEEAALAVKKKKAEFEEFYKCETYKDDIDEQQEDMKDETCHDGSEARKYFRGVSKSGSRWRARARNTTLKIDVHLGCYDTPEAAAIAVKKKETEFKEMFKNGNHVNVETCKVDFRGRESVYKSESGRWGARIWHPKLKYNASLGSYSTREKALVAVTNKTAELWKTYGWRAMVKPDCQDNGQVSEEPEHENESLSEISDELADDLKVTAGVCELKPGKWDARIIDPVSGDETWLGTFDMAKEAVRALNKCKADFSAKRKRTEFDGSEFCRKAMPGNERVKFDGSEFWSEAMPGNERDEFDGYDFGPNASPVIERAELDRSEVWPTVMLCNGRAELDGSESWPKAVPGDETKKGPPLTLECEFDDACRTSVVGADDLNALAVHDQANLEVATPDNEMAEFDGSEFVLKATSGNEAEEGCPVKLECEFDDGCLASVLSDDNLNAVALDDQSDHEVATPGNETAEFDRSEFVLKAKPGNEGCPVKLECESDDGCLTSVLGADNSNTVVVDDHSNHEAATPANEMAELDESSLGPNPITGNEANEGCPLKLECEFDDGCLTSVTCADNLNTVAVDDQPKHELAIVKSENSDEAMRLGIVNEYGQLVGEYSELDEQMGFGLPGNDADI